MRLFVALDLNESVRDAIAQFSDKLRAAFPAARWVRPEGIHVTLKFIGEIDDPLVPRIRMALSEVRSSAPVEMIFRGVGFFPNEKRPRVFWVGIDASHNLAEIAADVENRLAPLGITPESRAFRPHITLARIDEARGLEKLHTSVRDAGAVQFGAVRTSELHLYRSELVRGGSRYTRVESFTFAPLQ